MKLLPTRVPALALVIAMAGCAGPTTRYYTLAVDAAAQPAPARAAQPLFIEIAPLALPERLARPQLVVRKAAEGSTEVEVLEQHRWASSFENELRDALAAGVAARLGAVDATKGGRQPGQPAWRVAVQVRQFDSVEGARVAAALSWTVRRTDESRSATCQWSGNEPVGPGIDAVAQGAQRIVGKAAEAIAAHIGAIQAGPVADCRI